MKKNIVVFGGSSFNMAYAKNLLNLGHIIHQCGYQLITGGGTGVMTCISCGYHQAGGIPIGIQFSEKDHCPYGEIKVIPDLEKRTYELFANAHGYIVVASRASLGTTVELFMLYNFRKNKHPIALGKPSMIIDFDGEAKKALSYFLSKNDRNLIPIKSTELDFYVHF